MKLKYKCSIFSAAFFILLAQPSYADSIAELQTEAKTLQLPRAEALRLEESDDEVDQIPLDIEAQNSESMVNTESSRGLDVNGDGIRDDMERRIAAKFFGQSNRAQRAYAFMAAKRYQSILSTMLNPRSVYQDLSDLSYIKACFSAQTGSAEDELEKLLLPWAVNNLGRLRRYKQAVVKIDPLQVQQLSCN